MKKMGEGCKDFINNYPQFLMHILELLIPQIGFYQDEETFLERFRHIHKMANLLTWSLISKRRINETLSPSMNIEMTNFACKIPLELRDMRKLELSYLKRYHPETAKFILNGYIFSANSPWIIYKLLSNYIKSLNAIGLKIPFLQWYLKTNNFTPLEKLPEIIEFQKIICKNSDIIKDTFFNKPFLLYSNDPIRLMRLFNIALLKMRLEKGEDNLKDYLIEEMNNIRGCKIIK